MIRLCAKLLLAQWVTSSYGFPPIAISTPEVLVRQEIDLPPEAAETVRELQLFSYGSYLDLFSVTTASTTYKEQNEPNFEAVIGTTLASFEANGIKNIIPKQEEFTTASEIKGLKTYGSGQYQDPVSKDKRNIKYTMLNFGGKGFMQQIIITWEEGDEYAEKIVERILASVDVKTQV